MSLSDRLLPLLASTIVVVDAGAREALAEPQCPGSVLVGYDPDADECERMTAEAARLGRQATFVSRALWSDYGTRWFQENNAPGGGAFHRQNTAVTDRWRFENAAGQATNARSYFFPRGRTLVPTVRLAPGGDFLKLNIQGGELEVLAATDLSAVLGVLTEVAFVESYVGRPLFVDIDTLLRGAGLTLFDLTKFHRVGRAGAPVVGFPGGQLVECHALYLRDGVADKTLSTQQLLKLAVLAEHYGQVEYAWELVAIAAPDVRPRA